MASFSINTSFGDAMLRTSARQRAGRFLAIALWLTIVGLIGCIPVPSQLAGQSMDWPPAVDQATLAAHLEQLVETHGLPGAAAAILRGGELEAIAASGVRKARDDTPFLADDRVHLGSCTKAMTATLAAMLVDEGKLTWDSRLVEVVDELEGTIHADYHTITLRDLLVHRGGVPANARNWWLNGGGGDWDNRLAIAIDSLQRPAESQGEFHYSNLGYMLAGLMMSRVTGEDWEYLMRERLFDPLEMTTAGFGPPSVDDAIDQPWGHVVRAGMVLATQIDNAPALGPAGTVHCSLEDWTKFIKLHMLHMNAWQRDNPLVSSTMLEKLHTAPPGADYAMGWVVVRLDDGGVQLNHAGSNTTWFSAVLIEPHRGWAVLFSSNTQMEVAKPAFDDLLSLLAEPSTGD